MFFVSFCRINRSDLLFSVRILRVRMLPRLQMCSIHGPVHSYFQISFLMERDRALALLMKEVSLQAR